MNLENKSKSTKITIEAPDLAQDSSATEPQSPSSYRTIERDYQQSSQQFSYHLTSKFQFEKKLQKITAKSKILTSFNIFRSFVAIGILTLPFGMASVGFFIGFFIQVFVGFYVYYAIHLIIMVADDCRFESGNYEELGLLL